MTRYHKYPITDVFSKYGFGDCDDGFEYVKEAAEVLRQHGYTVCIIDATSHSCYIRVTTPEGYTLASWSECVDHEEINAILNKHFPSFIEIERW